MRQKSNKKGFTLTEIIVVLSVIAILAAASIPALLNFIESGRQMNRNNVARTIYLAAQNRLTELRVIGELDGFVADAGIIQGVNTVYYNISPTDYWTDEGNENYVHYISKPAGYHPDNPVHVLLSPVLTYAEVLNYAILIEFNINTGVVLSAFYSDRIDEFFYGEHDDNSDANIGHFWRGMNGGYENIARIRRQGFYGVGNTGREWSPPGALSVIIHDSYSGFAGTQINPLDIAHITDVANSLHNVLFARIIIPNDLRDSHYFTVRIPDSVPLMERSFHWNDTNFIPQAYGGFTILYEESLPEHTSVIWILDYVGGVAGGLNAFGGRIGAVDSINVVVEARATNDSTLVADATSLPRHPFFSGGAGTSGDPWRIHSARHLFNVRYRNNNENYHFSQFRHIHLYNAPYSFVSNFAPIPGFSGIYNGGGHLISSLRIPEAGNAGLFSQISGNVSSLIFDNPNVTGADNSGALAGTLSGTARNITIQNPQITGGINAGGAVGLITATGELSGVNVRFNPTETHGSIYTTSPYMISGAGNVGGIVGHNDDGMLRNSVFVSPARQPHVSGGTTGGLVGNNSGQLEQLLMLARAPVFNGHERPIVGANSATLNNSVLHFLAGNIDEPVRNQRPTTFPPSHYNMYFDPLGVGIPGDTITISQLRWAGWTGGNSNNLRYDYPYPQIGLFPNWGGYWAEEWPVTFIETRIEIIDSYEAGRMPPRHIYNASIAPVEQQIIANNLDNILFARATIEGGLINSTFILSIFDEDAPENSEPLLQTEFNIGADTGFGVCGFGTILYIETPAVPSGDRSIVWILDYVGGDTNRPRNNIFSEFIRPDGSIVSSVFARIEMQGNPLHVYDSSDTRNPFFATQREGDAFVIRSARHLFNIRHVNENFNFVQRGSIDMNAAPNSSVSNFVPIPVFGGTYSGFDDGSEEEGVHAIYNLTILPNALNTGLFGEISSSGHVSDLRLVNPTITGTSATGSIAGISSGNITNVIVQNPIINPTSIGTIDAGGVVGRNSGYVSAAVVQNSVINAGNNAGGVAGINLLGNITGVTMQNPTVTGTITAGGIVGVSTGLVANVNVQNPAVTAAFDSGGVAGNNEGSVSDAYVHFSVYEDAPDTPFIIHGSNNAGGIAGQNNGNVSYSAIVSAWHSSHISGGNAGGIVGVNNAAGSLENLMMLAVAPAASDGINPIAGENYGGYNNDSIHYLAGLAMRPNGLPFNLVRNRTGVGIPLDTDEMIEVSRSARWTVPTIDYPNYPTSRINPNYPYPFIEDGWGELAMHPYWPITIGAELYIENIYYFERYDDGSANGIFGFFNRLGGILGDAPSVGGVYNYPSGFPLRNDLTILQAGYVVILESDNAPHSHLRLFARHPDANEDDESFDILDNWIPVPNRPRMWMHVLRLDIFTDLYADNLDHAAPLEFFYGLAEEMEEDNKIYGVFHPRFARAIWASYEDLGLLDEPFSIRTPWQMQNISHGSEYTRFAQERDMNFALDGVVDGVIAPNNGAGASLENAVVTGAFRGEFDGGFHRISRVEIDRLNSAAPVGLFSRNYGLIENVILRDATIEGGVNTGGIAGVNEALGEIHRSGIEFSTIHGIDNVGGFVGSNNGLISDVYFLSTHDHDDPPVTVPLMYRGLIAGNQAAAVGGIVGLNNAIDGVFHTFFYAPAPRRLVPQANEDALDRFMIYPIIGAGEPTPIIESYFRSYIRDPDAEDTETAILIPVDIERRLATSFFLAGHRYEIIEDAASTREIHIPYNFGIGGTVTTHFAIEDDTPGSGAGGGVGLRTEVFNMPWLYNSFEANLNEHWIEFTAGFPYPLLRGVTDPQTWTEAHTPPRPTQRSRPTPEYQIPWDDWDTTTGSPPAPHFENGNFSRLNPDSPVNHNGQARNDFAYINMANVPNWYTRPVNRVFALGANAPWRFIELQDPNGHSVNDFMFTNFMGQNRARPATGTMNVLTSPFRYAELNATTPGILYQVVGTPIPGARFYYSFFHATNGFYGMTSPAWHVTPPADGDRLNFFLTGIDSDEPGMVADAGHALLRDNAMVMIRPAQSPRSAPALRSTGYPAPLTGTSAISLQYDIGLRMPDVVLNPAAWNTVAYGASNQLPVSEGSNASGGWFDLSFHRGRIVQHPIYGPIHQPIYYVQPFPRDNPAVLGQSHMPTGVAQTARGADENPVFLFDVWVDTHVATIEHGGAWQNNFPSAGDNRHHRQGFGITFWVSQSQIDAHPNMVSPLTVIPGEEISHTNIPLRGITADELEFSNWAWLDFARTQTIGYWDVQHGWRHFFGEYTVPEGQSLTEFAFQSASEPGHARVDVGNYLDGVSFITPSFVSINKDITIDGNETLFVIPSTPSDPPTPEGLADSYVTINLNIHNWGETDTDTFVIVQQLMPYQRYVAFRDASLSGAVRVNGNEVDWSNITLPTHENDHTLIIEVPNSMLSNNVLTFRGEGVPIHLLDVLNVTYDLIILAETNLAGTRDEPYFPVPTNTLLYFFENQARVTYREVMQTPPSLARSFEVFPHRRRSYGHINASVPIQVNIDPIYLRKTVSTVGFGGDPNNDPLVGGAGTQFNVTLTVEDALYRSTGFSTIETLGTITFRVPAGFEFIERVGDTGGIVDGQGDPVEHNITPNLDGTTSISIRNVNLGPNNRSLQFHYTLERRFAPDFGVMFLADLEEQRYVLAGGELMPVPRLPASSYTYIFISGEMDADIFPPILRFPQPVVGIRPVLFPQNNTTPPQTRVLPSGHITVAPQPDSTLPGQELTTSVWNFSAYSLLHIDNPNRIAHDGNIGNPILQIRTPDGEWSSVTASNVALNLTTTYPNVSRGVARVTLVRGTNNLEIAPLVTAEEGDTVHVYVRVNFVPGRAGGRPESFNLTTAPVRLTITVGDIIEDCEDCDCEDEYYCDEACTCDDYDETESLPVATAALKEEDYFFFKEEEKQDDDDDDEDEDDFEDNGEEDEAAEDYDEYGYSEKYGHYVEDTFSLDENYRSKTRTKTSNNGGGI